MEDSRRPEGRHTRIISGESSVCPSGCSVDVNHRGRSVGTLWLQMIKLLALKSSWCVSSGCSVDVNHRGVLSPKVCGEIEGSHDYSFILQTAASNSDVTACWDDFGASWSPLTSPGGLVETNLVFPPITLSPHITSLNFAQLHLPQLNSS